MTLEERYKVAITTKSDINEHVPKLRELASQCKHITEFGVRGGVSTTALLAGQPDVLISYDFHDCPIVMELSKVAGKTHFEFHKADVLTMPVIQQTDLLFLDTRHTETQVWTELSRHGSQVRRWIALHDTHTFGKRGTDGERGIMFAVRRWLPLGWSVFYQSNKNNGLLILKC